MTLSKWFCRTLKHLLRSCTLEPAHFNCYGFRPGYCCGHITGQLKQVVFFACRWKQPLSVFSADALTAFDSMQHPTLDATLTRRKVDPYVHANLIREVSNMSFTLSLPAVGKTNPQLFNAGGKQGGVETPDEFNLIVEDIWSDTSKRWEEKGMGFTFIMGDLPPMTVSHGQWADNTFGLASSLAQAKEMLQDLTGLLYMAKFSWKPSSMKIMATGSARGLDATFTLDTPGGPIMVTGVSELEGLGELLSDDASTITAMDHRLLQAKKIQKRRAYAERQRQTRAQAEGLDPRASRFCHLGRTELACGPTHP